MTLPEKNILNWAALLIVASFGIGISLWAYVQILALPIVADLETTGAICQNLCGDDICQKTVCLGSGCPCPETDQSCPQDCAKKEIK